MENEEKRILKAIKNLKDTVDLDIWKDPLEKNLAESNKARKKGNEIYAKNDHDLKSHLEILQFYSRSIAFAIENSEELALGYGNRSAILMHLKRYKESIEDIDRALKLSQSDVSKIKYLLRKVECQVELGLEEANETCEETKNLLQEMKASVEWKKGIVIKLAKTMSNLEVGACQLPQMKQKLKLPHEETFLRNRSSECPEASSALHINRDPAKFRLGRHIIATRDIQPGEPLYMSDHYVVFPMEECVYKNCSHCLNFIWAGLPCPGCVYAMYCSERCRDEAWKKYHDVECKIIFRLWSWSGNMNAGRLMSIRLLVMAIREAGNLEKLREEFKEIDQCKDYRKKGFSDNEKVFMNNYRSAYSLLNHMLRKTEEELVTISEYSALILQLLAKYTTIFKKHFDSSKKALARSEDAIFVAKILSHYQHVVITNAMTVKDAYSVLSTDWGWTAPKEENLTGICLTPFLSLLNHSCVPNVSKVETKNRQTILFAIRPIAKDGQLYDCYGPTYAELVIDRRRQLLLERFHFSCMCIACEMKWPIYAASVKKGIKFESQQIGAIRATSDALLKSDKIFESLKDGNFSRDLDVIQELAYAIILIIRHSKLPNWRLPHLVTTLITVLNEMYGYLIDVPQMC